MAAAFRRPGAGLNDQLLDHAHEFEFFQAVRLLERLGRAAHSAARPVGHDHMPNQEAVRFHSDVGLHFAPGEIQSVRPRPKDASQAAGETPSQQGPDFDMEVSFMGVTGSAGVLPSHYTRLVVERDRHRDESLRDFLDIFHHRLISLFYRAWRKYRVPIGFEDAVINPADERNVDWFAEALRSLAGMGAVAVRGRLAIGDDCLQFYSGHLGRSARNAVSLEQMLEEQFQVPVEVQQFCGEWMNLTDDDKAQTSERSSGQLGANINLGDQVWSMQSKFRVRLGPLPLSMFRRLLPSGDLLLPLSQLVRCYAGPDLDFDVQLLLQAEEIPFCRLGGDDPHSDRLGWDSWLLDATALHDDDSPVFEVDGGPVAAGVSTYTFLSQT